MGMVALLALVVVALSALTVSVFIAGRAVVRSIDRPRPDVYPTPTVDLEGELRVRIADNRAAIANLVLAVSEGIAHTKRHEKRIQKTVSGARRLLAEAGLQHAGLEAEVAELHAADEEELPPLRAVPPRLELVGPSGIPGFSREDLRLMREAAS